MLLHVPVIRHCRKQAEIKDAFQSYINKNRTMREKERENFGTDDDKNFSALVSKIKKKHL